MEEQQHIIETFSEMAPRYEGLMNSELSRFWGLTYEGFVSEFLDGVDTGPEDVILDIATGTAFIPSYLIRHKKPFKKVYGLDITFHMLHNAVRNIPDVEVGRQPELICASAHEMPIRPACIDRAFCCLATHHMDADLLLANIYAALKPGGVAHLADAGGSSKWKNGIIRFFIKSLAFFYFLITENYTRGLAESGAIANIHTAAEWAAIAEAKGFVHVDIHELRSRKFWAPNPIIMKFEKPKEK